jgi:hypothetical protein
MTLNDKMYINLIKTLTNEIKQAEKVTELTGRNKVFSVFWHIGKHILEYRKANSCEIKIVYDISKDLLKEFPTYIVLDPQNLVYMQYYAIIYPNYDFVKDVIFQLPEEDVKKRTRTMTISDETRAEIIEMLTK